MKKVIYEPRWDFHNSGPIVLRVTGEFFTSTEDEYVISARQARRIENHFCGMADCRCGSSGVGCYEGAHGRTYFIPVSDCR